MTRMSKSISFVLISSSLILSGCSGCTNQSPDEETDAEWASSGGDWDGGGGARRHSHPWYSGYGSSWYSGRGSWWGYGASPARTGTGGSRPASPSSVRSGGFGSTGHAVGS